MSAAESAGSPKTLVAFWGAFDCRASCWYCILIHKFLAKRNLSAIYLPFWHINAISGQRYKKKCKYTKKIAESLFQRDFLDGIVGGSVNKLKAIKHTMYLIEKHCTKFE